MKVLVTGAKGQLGTDLCAELARRGIGCVGVDLDDFDLTDAQSAVSHITEIRPDAVIHCAAWTAVDLAEEKPEACRRVNVEGAANVAEACRLLDCPVLYLSTDYVFGGEGETPYETDDPISPRSVYGRTKAEGEREITNRTDKYFIVRISWAFGPHGKNFVKTMLRLGREKESLTVVRDQVGSPTYTPDLSRLLCDMIVTEKYGVYHATNEGECSWAEFAQAIMRQAGLGCRIVPVTTEEYGAKAARPKNSRLSKRSLDEAGFARLPAWPDALARMLSACTNAAD